MEDADWEWVKFILTLVGILISAFATFYTVKRHIKSDIDAGDEKQAKSLEKVEADLRNEMAVYVKLEKDRIDSEFKRLELKIEKAYTNIEKTIIELFSNHQNFVSKNYMSNEAVVKEFARTNKSIEEINQQLKAKQAQEVEDLKRQLEKANK